LGAAIMVMMNKVMSHNHAHAQSLAYYTLLINSQGIYIFGILHDIPFQYRNWVTYSWGNKEISIFIFICNIRKNIYSRLNFKRNTAEYAPSLYVRLADT
jgi:hypothetical protein